MYALVRIGLIGLGRHGSRYANHLARGDIEGAVLAAGWRRDEQKGKEQADALEFRFEPQIERLCQSDDVDAVIGVVPVGLHVPIATAAAQAKKPLLLEKPMARTVAEAEQINALFRELPLTIAQTLRFDPLVRMLRQRKDEIGLLRGFDFEQRLEPRGLPWEDDPASSGGGVLLQTAIHAIDALRFITRAQKVSVVGATMAQVHSQKNEDHVLVHLKLDDTIIGDVRSSKIGDARHHRFTLYGQTGSLEADLIARTFTIMRKSERTSCEVPAEPTIIDITNRFVRFVEGGPNPVPPDEGLAAVRVAEAAYLCSDQWSGGKTRTFSPSSL